MTEQSDWEIIIQVKNGNTDQFCRLIDKYSNRLFQFLFARLKNKEDIDDILQESFLKAFRRIDQFNPKYQFSTWIYTIVYNEFCRSIKKNTRLKLLSDEDKLVAREDQSQDLDRGNVWLVARKLKADHFAMLWLKYEEELSVQEIAMALNMSKTGVKVGLHRARNKLKAFLVEEDQVKKKNSSFELPVYRQSVGKMI